MSTLPIFTPDTQVDPNPSSTYRWATVTDTDPLRVRLDGDTEGLPLTPDTVVSPTVLSIGSRVWVQFYGRRLIVLGKGGGTFPPVETVTLGVDPDFAWTGSFTFASSAALDTPTINAHGAHVFLNGRLRATFSPTANTLYFPLKYPARFQPLASFPRVTLNVVAYSSANAVGNVIVGNVTPNGIGDPAVSLMSPTGQAVSWTSSTWVEFEGSWLRNYP